MSFMKVSCNACRVVGLCACFRHSKALTYFTYCMRGGGICMLPKKQGSEKLLSVMPPSSKSSLITFLNRNGCFARNKDQDGPPLTHTLMDGTSGGKIALREGLEDAFFAAYGEDIKEGHKLFVIERRSSVFRMHLDCDFKVIPSDQGLKDFSDCVTKAVAPYFGGPGAPEARCVVCCVLGDNPGTRKAPGVHLMFPFARVDESSALWIRSGVVHALNGLSGFDEDWATVIDICVLTTSGLRMVGSDKCRTCPDCKNSVDSRLFCVSCSRVGKIPEDKVYWPHSVAPESDPEMIECLKDAKANNAHAARLCSTRLPPASTISPNFCVPSGAPACTTKKTKKKNCSEFDRQFYLSDEGPELPKLKSSSVLTLDTNSSNLLKNAIRGYHPGFERVDIREVREWKNPKGVTLTVKVAGFGARFCLNKGSDHASQSVYFTVTPLGGIAQRCFSRKEMTRKCCLCSEFTSIYKPLPKSLKAALFPSDEAPSVKVQHQQKRPSSEMQKSAARSADVISQLPTRLVRARSAVSSELLASLEIPSLCG